MSTKSKNHPPHRWLDLGLFIAAVLTIHCFAITLYEFARHPSTSHL